MELIEKQQLMQELSRLQSLETDIEKLKQEKLDMNKKLQTEKNQSSELQRDAIGYQNQLEQLSEKLRLSDEALVESVNREKEFEADLDGFKAQILRL